MQPSRSTSLPTPICSTQVGRGGSSRDPVWDLSLWLNAYTFVPDRSFTKHARTVGVLRTFSGTAPVGDARALVALVPLGDAAVPVLELGWAFARLAMNRSREGLPLTLGHRALRGWLREQRWESWDPRIRRHAERTLAGWSAQGGADAC